VSYRASRALGSWRIQHIHHNRFGSVWEYKEAFEAKKIDWKSVTGGVCPVCGDGAFRQIPPYFRMAEELYPAHCELIPVTRFQCLGKSHGRTASYLPHQLSPYFRYTVHSVLFAVLLWKEFWREPSERRSAYRVEQEIQGSGVPAWLLKRWLFLLSAGLRAAHGELCVDYDFSKVVFAGEGADVSEEVVGYLESLSRGPPIRLKAVLQALEAWGQRTGRFVLGVPSQRRGRASSNLE
jgi:hypothetical protein